MQCAAVTTQFGAMRDPPQNKDPYSLKSPTCHGQAPLVAFLPPTILDWATFVVPQFFAFTVAGGRGGGGSVHQEK